MGTFSLQFFVRLLFKNSEEVKRIRFFSEPNSSGYEIALAVLSSRLSLSRAHQALSMILATRRRGVKHAVHPNGAQGYRVKLSSACGGCLGDYRRRRTLQPAISHGELASEL
jgi:hypothetical protein